MKTTRGMAQLSKHLSGEDMVRFLKKRKAQKIRKESSKRSKEKHREEEKQQKAAKR